MSKPKSAGRSKPYSTSKRARHAPLSDQILEEDALKSTGRQKIRGNRKDDDDEYASAQLSRKILLQARKQQEELEEEHGSSSVPGEKTRFGAAASGRFSRSAGSDSDDEDVEDVDEDITSSHFNTEQVIVDEEDEKALERFMPAETPARRTLADIIQEKLTEKKTEMTTAFSDNASLRTGQLDDRLVSIYKSVRDILRKYRSGKLPKPFKVIPKLENWEEILFITEPDSWSAAAMYQATRIFVSNLKANMAQRFLNLVLLPRVRDDIEEFKRLNFHLYQAIKKGLFKPNAFFKGFLLPLCESGTCTLREATIVASVLAKDSIPMLSSAAAILQIAEMRYNGANSIFLRTLLDKKYALPYRVVDAVVFHFLGFRTEKRVLPVLWHQCLLTFVQRYKQDVSSEQREALLELLRLQPHPSITPEVRRELTGAQCRDLEVTEAGAAGRSVEMRDNDSDYSDVDEEEEDSDME